MAEDANWNDIITYHRIPTERTGVFWMSSNRIHIYHLVKKYDYYHKYILAHEKNHYNNYNSGKKYVIRIMYDVWNEWKMGWDLTFNKELKDDYKKYKEELSCIAKKDNIIKDIYVLIEKLGEKKATEKELRYANIVWCFRPYESCSYPLIFIVGLILAVIITALFLIIVKLSMHV